jgi:hypothetical protein
MIEQVYFGGGMGFWLIGADFNTLFRGLGYCEWMSIIIIAAVFQIV